MCAKFTAFSYNDMHIGEITWNFYEQSSNANHGDLLQVED